MGDSNVDGVAAIITNVYPNGQKELERANEGHKEVTRQLVPAHGCILDTLLRPS
jgi:hypothetical protein